MHTWTRFPLWAAAVSALALATPGAVFLHWIYGVFIPAFRRMFA